MFFVIKTGGKQYLTSDKEEIVIEKINKEVGNKFEFAEVLAYFDDKKLILGNPTIPNMKIKAKILAQDKSEKKFGIKYKSKKHYRRTLGRRQPLTKVLIENVSKKAEKEENNESAE